MSAFCTDTKESTRPRPNKFILKATPLLRDLMENIDRNDCA